MDKRHVNLDLLRIICMMMVVCFHFYNHGGLVNDALKPGGWNWYVGNTMFALSYVAVNCFVLLSGYFQCTSKFKLKRLASVWLQAACYSVALYVITGVSTGNFTVTGFIKSGMVVTMNQYWFVSAYFLMYAVSPFLNYAIQAMSKKMHFLCCCVLLGIFSVAHNLVYISDFGNVRGGSSLLWFCVLYVVAAYIRLHVPVEPKHSRRWFALYAICGTLIAVERFAAYAITPMFFGRVVLDSLFYANNSILNAAAAISLFMAVRSMEIKNAAVGRIIGFFAPLAFGVYLIHDHPAVRPRLWGWLNPADYAESAWMVGYALVCVVCIFVVCCLVEWVRQKLFGVLGIDRLVQRCCENLQNKVSNWLNEEKEAAL